MKNSKKFYRAFGKLLKQKRKAKRLTQEDVAQLLGKSQQRVNEWEHGKGITGYELFRLCALLGIDTGEVENLLDCGEWDLEKPLKERWAEHRQ